MAPYAVLKMVSVASNICNVVQAHVIRYRNSTTIWIGAGLSYHLDSVAVLYQGILENHVSL